MRQASSICWLLLVILLVTAVLVIGIKESANLNSAIVMVKLGVVGIFLVLGRLLSHSSIPSWRG